jgi:hypothetical protein
MTSPTPVLPVEHTDSERLDWLDKQRNLFFDCYMQDGKITHILRQHWGAALGCGPSPRAAIDAAMAGDTPIGGQPE